MGQTKEIMEFGSFDQFMGKLREACPHFVFRGLSRYDHALKTRVGRELGATDSQEQRTLFLKKERTLFEMFRARARVHTSNQMMGDWEWLALAQHYGVPTRLMDWTENPLVALYFVAKSDPDEDGALLWFHLSSLLPTNELSPFDDGANGFVLAPYVTPRLAAQGALFSVDGAPWSDFEPNGDDNVIKCRVKAEFKRELNILLPKLGVTPRALFADLDSYAKDSLDMFQGATCKDDNAFRLIEFGKRAGGKDRKAKTRRARPT